MNQGFEDLPNTTEEAVNYGNRKNKNNRAPEEDCVAREVIKINSTE